MTAGSAPSPTEATTTQPASILTDAAADKVKALLEQEGRDDLRLRVAVQPGGCSGLRYQLFFDERSLDGDVVTDFGGVEVVVDRMSVPYLTGATIDFVDRIDAPGLHHRQPQRAAAPAPAATRSTRPLGPAPRGRARRPGAALRLSVPVSAALSVRWPGSRR